MRHGTINAFVFNCCIQGIKDKLILITITLFLLYYFKLNPQPVFADMTLV